jgi:hypothetical protein
VVITAERPVGAARGAVVHRAIPALCLGTRWFSFRCPFKDFNETSALTTPGGRRDFALPGKTPPVPQ